MNIISFLASVQAPHDLWTILMNWIQGAIGNLGWTLLVLTVLVKLVTSPLDFMVKYNQKKQSLIQQKCAPEIAKFTKKYGTNKQAIQVQTNALYKREGFSMGTGCIVMLVNMILTCAIFFSFYSTLRKASAYEAINQYEQIEQTFESSYYKSMADYSSTDELVTAEDAKNWIDKFESFSEDSEDPEYTEMKTFYENNTDLFKKAQEDATKDAVDKWNSIKSSWLWVDNIWVEDATTKPFPTYERLTKIASNGSKYYSDYVKDNIAEEDYKTMASIIGNNTTRKYNGYYILAVLAAVVTFLSQMVAELHTKLKNKKANSLAKQTNTQNQMSLKMMKIIMPIVMVLFVLTSSASFGIYTLASNVSAIAVGEIINLIVNKLTKKKQEEVETYLEKEADRLIKKGKFQE